MSGDESASLTCATRKIAVIGGGWAGCAAAAELALHGLPVTLYEASRTLGGRARRVELNGLALDNGQHIMLGAYSETLRLMRTLDIEPAQVLLRLPLQMRYPQGSGGMDFVAPRLPAPLHVLLGLISARGLAFEDKLSLVRFSTIARRMDWQLLPDCSVAELLDRFDQADRLTRLMWRPLCIAALNTPPERASAQVFLNVLHDSLGARRTASDMLLPKTDLTRLLPQRAAMCIEAHGGNIRSGEAVRSIVADGERWRLHTGETKTDVFDAVIIATQSAQAAALLGELIDVSALAAFRHEPITTCYLQYESTLHLQRPFFALLDDPAAGQWGQFVFDRGQLDADQAGLLAVVVSASTEAMSLGHLALAASIASQLASALRMPALATPRWTKIISEKRATFSCMPGLNRPDNETGRRGLLIAGDYTAGDYPATLESAVRSGLRAARCLLD